MASAPTSVPRAPRAGGRHRRIEPPRRVAAADGQRPEIQGLRAVAVSVVVLFHLHPALLRGGFVGVDVFFVISGYLITGHLARTFRRTGRVGLGTFYARRIRRLVPAAVLVLVATWVAARWVLPVTQLPATAEQIRASALYVQNWVLARDAVDYFVSSAPSPVQHYWSLSVEEQFYIVWPLLFLAAAGFAALRRTRTAAVVPVVLAAAVLLTSLGWALHSAQTDPGGSYFVTTTRMWELAAGGTLALLPPALTRRVGRWGPLGWVGLGVIAASAVLISGTGSFLAGPALWPVGGAVLVLLCGSGAARFGPAALLSVRPMVFLGDISYSLYLWHFPLIVLTTAYAGHAPGLRTGIVLLAVMIVLSWLTKVAVEDPIRRSPRMSRHTVRSLAVAAIAVVPVALASVWLAGQPGPAAPARIDAQHPGAAALATDPPAQSASSVPALQSTGSPPGRSAQSAKVVPTLLQAAKDWSGYEKGPNGCQTDQNASGLSTCWFGDTKNYTKTVAIVGDSVAGQWFGVVDALAKREHWRVVTELHSLCPWTATLARYTDGSAYTTCQDWGRTVLDELVTKIRPDVVLTSARPTLGTMDHPEPGAQAFAQLGKGMATYWTKLHAAGIATVAIHESPEMSQDIPDCLARHHSSTSRCSDPASDAVLRNTPIDVAARLAGNAATLVDLNRYICGPTRCSPIVGNVIVYIDSHHLTNTFARSLAPYLDRALLALPALAR